MIDPSLQVKKEMMIDTLDTSGAPLNMMKQADASSNVKNIRDCKGECCSRHGSNFVKCIMITFDIITFDIYDIVHERYFVEGKDS